MTGRTWTAKLKSRDLELTSERLSEWRGFYVNDSDLLSRMSELMSFDMYVLDKEFGVSPPTIFLIR